MTGSASPLAVLGPLFRALDDTEDLLRLAHPDLPLDDSRTAAPAEALLADTVLLLVENLRAAARAYHRERHLAALLPPL